MNPLGSVFRPDDDTPVYVISVAAQLAGMHAQTLRQYDRLGIVSPSRTLGGGRRYSSRNIAALREVQRLSQEEGVSLAGVRRIMHLEGQVRDLRTEIAELSRRLEQAESGRRVFAAGRAGEVVAVPAGQRPTRAGSSSRDLMVWRPLR